MTFYKATRIDGTGFNLFLFEEGKTYEVKGKPTLCKNGFHYVDTPIKVLEFYHWPLLLWEVEPLGEIDSSFEKSCTTKILMKRQLGEEETKALLTGTLKVDGYSGYPCKELEYKDGKLDGVIRHYYVNGNLASEVHYKDGKENGPLKTYNSNGELVLDRVYKDGELMEDKIIPLY